MRFGMKETGTLGFRKICPETNTPNSFFTLKLGVFQILESYGRLFGAEMSLTHTQTFCLHLNPQHCVCTRVMVGPRV